MRALAVVGVCAVMLVGMAVAAWQAVWAVVSAIEEAQEALP